MKSALLKLIWMPQGYKTNNNEHQVRSGQVIKMAEWMKRGEVKVEGVSTKQSGRM